MREQHARRAERRPQQPAAHDAVADRPGRVVRRAADDGRAFGEPQFLCCRGRDRAGDVRRFETFRQQPGIELQLLQHLGRPLPIGDIEQQRAGCIGHFRRVHAGHAIADVILRQQHLGGLGEVLRLVVAEPENFGRSEAGECGVGDELDEFFASADGAEDFVALGRGALVVPQNSRADDIALGIQKHAPVHLPREPDARDVRRLDPSFFQHRSRGRDSGRPPVARPLLAPAGLRGEQFVLRRRRREHTAAGITQQRFRAAGSDVDAEQVAHSSPVDENS